jgi:hypothetical protein
MAAEPPTASCNSLFKQLGILPIPFQYILSLINFITNNQEISPPSLSPPY